MDAREQKGLEIAAMVKLVEADGEWIVPSQAEMAVAQKVTA